MFFKNRGMDASLIAKAALVLVLALVWHPSFSAQELAEATTRIAPPGNIWSVKASPRALSMADVLLLGFGAALVFFMQAGFAMLESGMSRAKNMVNVLMKNYLDMCFGGIAFWLVGYGLMFGLNESGFWGEDHFLFQPQYSGDYLFFLFQVMFCSTAATIVSGAVAERMKLTAYIVGSVLISAFIYPIYGAWVWGGWHGGAGWLADMGYIDFAGSSVVHMVGGWCALAALIVLKPRLGRFGRDGKPREIPGHNMGLVATGAFILWLGWFGFNGSSVAVTASGADESYGRILANTHLAGLSGAVGAILAMKLAGNKARLSVALNGGIAGLVAITAGCQVMDPAWALVTGLTGGLLCYWSMLAMEALKYDDVVGAVPVHLVNGIWGTLAAGMFNASNFMSVDQILVQLIGIAAGSGWAFLLALIVYGIIHATIGMRAPSMDEQRGLDYSEHDEIGYPEFQDALHAKNGGV